MIGIYTYQSTVSRIILLARVRCTILKLKHLNNPWQAWPPSFDPHHNHSTHVQPAFGMDKKLPQVVIDNMQECWKNPKS